MTNFSLAAVLLGRHYIGVEHYSFEDSERVVLLGMQQKKGELLIESTLEDLYTGTLPGKPDKKLPYFIVINTNQVLQKEVNETNGPDEKLLYKAFPSLAHADFYYEIWRMKTKSLVAIARRTYVDQLIFDYRRQGIRISGFSLGVCSLHMCMGYSDKNLQTNHQLISKSEVLPLILSAHENTTATYELNGLSITSESLLAFSGILRIVTKQEETSGTVTVANEQLWDGYLQRSFFIKGLHTIIGLLLLLLLVNFLVFNHYYTKTRNTAEILQLNASSHLVVVQLKKHVKEKEQKVNSLFQSAAFPSSIVLNDITRIVPGSILLSELSYNPLDKKIKEEDAIAVIRNTILISGITSDNAAFTNWVEQLEKLPNSHQVIISHFGKTDSNQTEFILKVILKDEIGKEK